jgi:hypothetical protein
VGDGGLHGAHENVRVAAVVHRHLAHHQRRRLHLHVAVEQRKHAGVPLHLPRELLRHRMPDRAVEFTDHHFGFRRRPRLLGLDQRFAGTQPNTFAHARMISGKGGVQCGCCR